jgi:hypothetical protein
MDVGNAGVAGSIHQPPSLAVILTIAPALPAFPPSLAVILTIAPALPAFPPSLAVKNKKPRSTLPTGAFSKALEGNGRLPFVMKGYFKSFAPLSRERNDITGSSYPRANAPPTNCGCVFA